MKQNKQYLIDLWLFISSITVLLFLLLMNIMFVKNWSNDRMSTLMEFISIPIFSVGAFIPLIAIFRIVLKKPASRALAILTLLFSLLTAVLIGYTALI